MLGGAVRKGAVAPEKNFCNPLTVTFSGVWEPPGRASICGKGDARVAPTVGLHIRDGLHSGFRTRRSSDPFLPLVGRRGVKFYAPTRRHRRERTCEDPHVCNGNNIQDDPENGFSSSHPFILLPPSGSLRHSDPLRHSGESRNPEDTFPLDPGFRRGGE